MTPDEHYALIDIQNKLANTVIPALQFVENDDVGGTEDNAKGVAATVHRIEADVKALQVASVNLQPVLDALAAITAKVVAIETKIDKDLA